MHLHCVAVLSRLRPRSGASRSRARLKARSPEIQRPQKRRTALYAIYHFWRNLIVSQPIAKGLLMGISARNPNWEDIVHTAEFSISAPRCLVNSLPSRYSKQKAWLSHSPRNFHRLGAPPFPPSLRASTPLGKTAGPPRLEITSVPREYFQSGVTAKVV